MTNITEIIEKAAERHAEDYFNSPETKDPGDHFTAGASFATTDPEMMKAMLKPFGDWLWRSYKQIDAQVWKERWTTSDTVYTLYQVIDKYIQCIIDNGK